MSTALLTIDETAAYLGMAKSSIYSSRSRGNDNFPPAIKIGRHLRWRKESINAWLDQKELEAQKS